jgi:hypothetical protein
MSLWDRLSLGFAFSALLCVGCSAQQSTVVHQDAASLLELARTYGQGSDASGMASVQQTAETQKPVASDIWDTEEGYRR